MNKKYVLFIMSILSAIAIFFTGCANFGTPVFSIDNQTALIGDSIVVPINIKKNSGLYVGQIVIQYDGDVLEFVSGGNGEVFDECVVNGKDVKETVMIIANQSGIKDTKKNGTLATLNFKVKETAVRGNTHISFYLPDHVESGTYCLKYKNIDEEKWTIPECIDGIITVK